LDYLNSTLGTQYHIVVLRSDNAPEFLSAEARAFYRDNGIFHETSVAHRPSQNGMSERHGGIISSMARSMLNASNMPLRFWPLAVYYSCYTKNMLSTLSDFNGNLRSPYEMVFSMKPSAKALRVYDCLCWRYLPNAQQH